MADPQHLRLSLLLRCPRTGRAGPGCLPRMFSWTLMLATVPELQDLVPPGPVAWVLPRASPGTFREV